MTLQQGELINRVWDSRWTGEPSVFSGQNGGSYSPGGALPINAKIAIQTRGLDAISGVVNNAERGAVYQVLQDIPAWLQTSIGGTEPEILITPEYRQYLQILEESISTLPQGR